MSGRLPSGLVLDSGTGAITGTPIAVGAFTFTVRARSGTVTADKPLTLFVADPLTGTYDGDLDDHNECRREPGGVCRVRVTFNPSGTNRWCYGSRGIPPGPPAPVACFSNPAIDVTLSGTTFTMSVSGDRIGTGAVVGKALSFTFDGGSSFVGTRVLP